MHEALVWLSGFFIGSGFGILITLYSRRKYEH